MKYEDRNRSIGKKGYKRAVTENITRGGVGSGPRSLEETFICFPETTSLSWDHNIDIIII